MSCTGECKVPKKLTLAARNNANSADDADVWASDDEIDAYADLHRAHVTQGYIDGIAQAQEASLQNGFDEGFPNGASLGCRVGRVLALLHGFPEFEEAKNELNVTSVLSKDHFDESLTQKSHALVEKWEALAASKVSD